MLVRNIFVDSQKEIKLCYDVVRKKLIIQRELLSLARLDVYTALKNNPHQSLPKIYSITISNEKLIINQEYIDGGTLEHFIIKTHRFTYSKFKEIFSQLLDVVDHCHKITPSIIHRDIKLSNIILSSNKVVLIDFDVARQYRHLSIYDTDQFGTIGYASPEQYGYKQTDQRSDIFSLGKVMEKLIYNVIKDEIDLILFMTIIKKATQFHPMNRYQSIEEFRNHFLSTCQIFEESNQ